MTGSPRDIMKPRKRPAVTGDQVMDRVQPEVAKLLDSWRRKQEDLQGRPEAIRRLVEIGLTVGATASPSRSKAAPAERAKELAAKIIEKLSIPSRRWRNEPNANGVSPSGLQSFGGLGSIS